MLNDHYLATRFFFFYQFDITLALADSLIPKSVPNLGYNVTCHMKSRKAEPGRGIFSEYTLL